MKLLDLINPREIRRRLGLNQEEFWTRIGVTQSGGSRYESGRAMPKPVRQLLRLVHVERIDLSRVEKEDFEIIDHLKSQHPESLSEPAQGGAKQAQEARGIQAGIQALARNVYRWAGGLVRRRNSSCADWN